ncbi:hypothetical protein Tco_0629938 [Tanacetum coccineum]|uniref:Uncharacterized protein n=1 Tax=Tanacetum coccineum TaxID=301880 RepID=A0ABQ4WUJ2_9ASTR
MTLKWLRFEGLGGTSEMLSSKGFKDLHVTWAHLEKKRTRLQTNTKTLEDLCSQSLETASQAIHDAVTTHKVTASQHFETASARTDSHADLEDSTYDGVLENQLLSVSLLISLGKHDCVERIPSDEEGSGSSLCVSFVRGVENDSLIYNLGCVIILAQSLLQILSLGLNVCALGLPRHRHDMLTGVGVIVLEYRVVCRGKVEVGKNEQ